MNEKAILDLISHSVRQILQENGAKWDEIDEAHIGEEIANVAWTALIVGARELLARGQPVVLEGFGRFEVVEGSWRFDAAESLQEAKSLSLPPNEGNQFLSEQALYFLSRATELVRRIPADSFMEREGLSPEQKLVNAIFGEQDVLFGEVLRARVRQLMQSLDDDVAQSRLMDATMGISESRDEQAKNRDDQTAAMDSIEVGRVYEGTVTEIHDLVAIVELLIMPGRPGTLPVTEIPTDGFKLGPELLKVGQKVNVKVLEANDRYLRFGMRGTTGDIQQQKPDLSSC